MNTRLDFIFIALYCSTLALLRYIVARGSVAGKFLLANMAVVGIFDIWENIGILRQLADSADPAADRPCRDLSLWLNGFSSLRSIVVSWNPGVFFSIDASYESSRTTNQPMLTALSIIS